jgi:glycosyltransferase involved in cell wall biosynthesis
MTSSPPAGISVVVPAYNEAESIVQMLKDLKENLLKASRETEIIVVDDGSADNTGLMAEQAGVRVIHHPINYGYGRAILSGIDAAAFDTIAILDADGSYPSENLLPLMAYYDKGFDMVVGAREGVHYYQSLMKRCLRMVFNFLAEFSTGRRIPDINSGMRIFRKSYVIEMRRSISTGFSFTTTITLLFFLNGLFVGFQPIPYRKRIGSSKVRLARDGLRSLQIIVTVIAEFNPLKLYFLLLLVHLFGTALLALFQFKLILLGWQTACLIVAAAILSIT